MGSFLSNSGCRFSPEPDDMSEWVAETAESAVRHSFMHCLAAPHIYGAFNADHHSEVLRKMLPTPGESKGCFRVDLQLPRGSMHSTQSLRGKLQAQNGTEVNYNVAVDLMKGLRHSQVCLFALILVLVPI
jgi:hypothetical protein